MSELLPCPFCGGNPTVIVEAWSDQESEIECRVAHFCDNETMVETNVYGTRAEAIAAWNTRAGMSYEDALILLDEFGLSERTCRVIEVTRGISYEPDVYELTCGHDPMMFKQPNYCPSCGAKVVSE